MTLTDFTLSNARRFYSLMGNPFRVESKGLTLAFSDSIPTEITESAFTVTESILRKKIFASSLYLSEIVLLREQIGQ